ncbi:MAG: xanthine dehydrogenase family protein molybdopterin-binding subunit, partial [Acidobacteriaceae bacterium]|nr:xanthine dehydrogenase family protein molybdopterin-binding subunit [Acidobacteriaceae bacterium]
MATTQIGAPVNRVDGRQKITGAAQYAGEIVLGDMAHGVLVGSAVPAGRIRRISVEQAERAPGVLLVLTHANRGPLGKMPNSFMDGGQTAESRPPLENDLVFHNGQAVAMVVATGLEQARYAASLVEIEYEPA